MFGQNNLKEEYNKYLDSADVYVSEHPLIAQNYLDSIPEPVTVNIKGRLAEYYQLKGLVSDKFNEDAKEFQYFLLALKYAKQEKNYDIAGMSSIELFYNTLIIKNDTTAYKYLDEAKAYYTLSNNVKGLADVMQMAAYVELYNSNYEKSNQLIFEHLEHYKSIKEDQFYYMYALFMLTSNYTHLYDLGNTHKYLKLLEKIKGDITVSPSLHSLHVVSIYNCLAEEHLKHKAKDSSLIYLQKAGGLRKYMDDTDLVNYYTFYSNYYDTIADFENKRVYVDSLQMFHKQELKETIDANLEINKTLLISEKQLESETKKKHLNRYLIGLLLAVLFGLCVFIVLRYKKIKQLITEYTKRDSEFSYLKTNHEKLKAKVHGLEEYISEVKKEVKNISSVDNVTDQQKRIVELYKDIHHNSSTLLAKGESHLELINDLNVDFFAQITDKYPQLNSSEIIICYYLFIGFKNKEIAAFLNTSVRAIESKRYRISKKLNLQEKDATLLELLNTDFEGLKKTEN